MSFFSFLTPRSNALKAALESTKVPEPVVGHVCPFCVSEGKVVKDGPTPCPHFPPPDDELVKERRLTRKLRAEIRVLHQRYRDASRGAERNAHVSWGLATSNHQLRQQVNLGNVELRGVISGLVPFAGHKDGCRVRYKENCSCGFAGASAAANKALTLQI